MKHNAIIAALLSATLWGAAAVEGSEAAEAGGVALTTAAMPVEPAFGAALPARGAAIANESLARVFTTLTHDMEWGDSRPHLVRYEGPVVVGLEGPGITQYGAFIDDFLALLRQNAGIDIARGTSGHNLHIRLVGEAFTELLPTVSCLVAPGDISWGKFAKNPGRHGGRALARARQIDHMTIFIPRTAAPYLVRNCLLEEITQALGTANDLYGLGDSIFNDDAAHVWPTGLDFLMLRVLYSPEMRTGLDRGTTERTARAVLDRINPAGIAAAPMAMPQQERMAKWRRRIHRVFSRRTGQAEAARLAMEALEIARSMDEYGVYHCHSLLTLGRVTARKDPSRALEVFDRAGWVCEKAHGPQDVRVARIGIERAVALLRLRRFSEVLPLTEQSLPILVAHGQDERVSSLHAVRAAALAALGKRAAARKAERVAEQWRAYALGIENDRLARSTGG